MSPVVPSFDRRLRIADAALQIIANQGTRHLSHRAVDAALSLPPGSTSYYFSTRAALLEAAVSRLVEADATDIAGLLASGPAALPTDVLAFSQALLALWTAPAARTHLAARLELLLDAARVGPAHPLLVARRELLARTERAFAEAGSAAPGLEALRLVACMDGLLLHELVGAHLANASAADVLGSLGAAARPNGTAARPAGRSQRR